MTTGGFPDQIERCPTPESSRCRSRQNDGYAGAPASEKRHLSTPRVSGARPLDARIGEWTPRSQSPPVAAPPQAATAPAAAATALAISTA